jgi:hypothetical protein
MAATTCAAARRPHKSAPENDQHVVTQHAPAECGETTHGTHPRGLSSLIIPQMGQNHRTGAYLQHHDLTLAEPLDQSTPSDGMHQ